MQRKLVIVVIGFLALVGLAFLHSSVYAQAAQPGPSILDGVYTDAQAMRGEAEYMANCAKCHEGECPEGPPLSMMIFTERWREENLSFLFGFMKTRMPAKAEGSLTDSVYLDILTYLLKKNEYPSGKAELTLDSLDKVKFVGKEGPKPLPTNSLVQVVGCLVKDPVNGWMLNKATDLSRTLRGEETTPQELADARAKKLGASNFEIQDDRPGAKPDTLTGHKVYAKGALIRQNTGTHRIILTALESLATTCR